MRILVTIAVLSSVAAADGYKMEKPKGGKCGVLRPRAMLPFELLVDGPDEGKVEDMSSSKTDQVSALKTDDFHWGLRVYPAEKRDLDFAGAKKKIEADAKKYKHPVTWKTSEKTADGYRLLFSEAEEEPARTEYNVIYLRTVGKQKLICYNNSEWADSFECTAKACESLRAP